MRSMVLAALLGWGTLAVAAPAGPVPGMQETADPAADLVHNFGLGDNLEQMAVTAARMTHAYGEFDPAEVEAEIHRLAPGYRAQWDANLAAAYTAHLPAEALRSLARQGSASPYFASLQQQRAAVGEDMRVSSSSILKALVAEALGHLVR